MAHIHSVYTLLLRAFLTGCVCGSDLTVWQSPERINAIEGQPVNINCSFTYNSTAELLRVIWLKNNTQLYKHVCYNISALRSQNFNSRTVSQTSVLHLPSVQLNDSGTYYCKVWYDVPELRQKHSEQGTELRVETVVDFTIVTSPAPAKPFVVTVMGASALDLVLMTACIKSVLCITYKCQHKRPKDEGEGQPAQREDESSVLFTALKALKPEDRKNTQTQQVLNQDCSTDNEVLYSCIRLKPQKQKHTALSN